MTLADYKAQASRLQAYSQSRAAAGSPLACAKHSFFLEAIAAVHGARDWNTLCASVSPAPALRANATAFKASEPHPSLAPVFGGLGPGGVHYLSGRAGTGKSSATAGELVEALSRGYKATVLDVGQTYHGLALSRSQAAISTAQSVSLADVGKISPETQLVAIDFSAWHFSNLLLVGEHNFLQEPWANVLPTLDARTGSGTALVVEELPLWRRMMGNQLHLLVSFLAEARARGTAVHLIGQRPEDFAPFRALLPADKETSLTR